MTDEQEQKSIESLGPAVGILADGKKIELNQEDRGLTEEEEAIKAKLEKDGHIVEVIGDNKPKTKLNEIEEMAKFLADPQNKQNAFSLATEILDATRGKWFTLERFVGLTNLTSILAYQKLSMVKQFGHIQERTGNPNDGPQKNGQQLFKVVITKEAKIQAWEEAIKFYEEQIADCRMQIRGLSG